MDTDQRTPLVPDGFQPPAGLATASFLLEPLGPQHNDSDYDAWTSSMEHIRATPGYPDGSWPHPMTLEQNRGDLERHQRDFQIRKGFTYTVLDPESRSVIGCVYIYPSKQPLHDAEVLLWVTGHPRPARRAAVAGGLGVARSRLAVPLGQRARAP